MVCEKPVGVLSEASERAKNMPDLVKKQTKSYKISVVHRLDKAVGGLMVFSKNPKSTAFLSRQIQNREMLKEYYAVIKGKPEQDEGIFEDILFRDKQKNKSFVVKTERKGAKYAKLEYRVIQSVNSDEGVLTLVKVRLHTGRTHQIRVQFASRKMPLLGDEKYGGKSEKCNISLFSCHLAFRHIGKEKLVDISLNPPKKYPWNLFNF